MLHGWWNTLKKNTKLHFQQQEANIFSQAIRLVSFSPLHSLLTLYCILVKPKFEYASVAWNSVTCSDACKMQHIQRQFVSLCHHRFSSHIDYSHGNVCNCRSQWPRGLRRLRPLACWDRGFESHRGHGCLSVVSVVCCQVEVSATSWSLVQRSPTECGASLGVILKPQEWGGHDPRWVAAPQKKKTSNKHVTRTRIPSLCCCTVLLFIFSFCLFFFVSLMMPTSKFHW